MGQISTRMFGKRKFVLLNSYATKPEANYFATQYKDDTTGLVRVVESRGAWLLWVCPVPIN